MKNENTTTQYRTENYGMLEKVEDGSVALKFVDAISAPTTIIERCDVLLWDFIEDYFEPVGKKELKYDIKYRWEVITARINVILDQIRTASAMLNECLDFYTPHPLECQKYL